MRALIARRPARGFSMVELMVAMVISLIGVIIIFQVFETSEGVRRTATSGGGRAAERRRRALLHGYATAQCRHGRQRHHLCGLQHDRLRLVRHDPQFPPLGNPMILAPRLDHGGADAQTPDQFAVFYGSQNQIGNSDAGGQHGLAHLAADRGRPRFAFRPGDLLLLLEPGSGQELCVHGSHLPSGAAKQTQINHDSGTLHPRRGGLGRSALQSRGRNGVTYGGANTANVARVVQSRQICTTDIKLPRVAERGSAVYNLYAVANRTLHRVECVRHRGRRAGS